MAVEPAGRAEAAPTSRDRASMHRPPMMQNLRVSGPLKRQGNAARYAMSLVPRDLTSSQAARRNIVPAMRTQLILPDGMKLLTRGNYRSRFSDRLWRGAWHRPMPSSNRRWRIVNGAPTWTVLRVGASAPTVAFWVGGHAGQCFRAKTVSMERRNGHWATIAHAPVETARTCLPSRAAPTTSPPAPPPRGWTNVVDDQFNGGGIPSHWSRYSNPYRSGPDNCTDPAHDFVAGGYLHLVESYESSKPAGVDCPYGAGWYTGGLTLPSTAPYNADNQRVTVRFRIVSVGGVVPHYIIPMRRADNAEEDVFESDVLSFGHTFLHYAGGRIRSDPAFSIDVTHWHTVRFTQLDHLVSIYVDNMKTPVWSYHGNATTTPDATQSRHLVLQQECSHVSGCPKGTSGSSDIQVDWITVDNAS